MAFPFMPAPSWPEFIEELKSLGVREVVSKAGVRHLKRIVGGDVYRTPWPYVAPGDDVQPSKLQATVTGLGFDPVEDFGFRWPQVDES